MKSSKYKCIRSWRTNAFTFHYGDYVTEDDEPDCYFNPNARGSQFFYITIPRNQFLRHFISEEKRKERYSGCSGVIRYYKSVRPSDEVDNLCSFFKLEFDGDIEDFERDITHYNVGSLKMGDLRISYSNSRSYYDAFSSALEIITDQQRYEMIEENEFERLKIEAEKRKIQRRFDL